MAVDRAGNLYVADAGNSAIRKVTPTGVVTTLAGLPGSPGSADGTGSRARFEAPYGVAVDSAGNVYVADTFNFTIRKVTPAGVVTTLAGKVGGPGSVDGTGSGAQFEDPAQFGAAYGVAVDRAGNLYVADSGNDTIRKLTLVGVNWVVSTLAGLAGSSGASDGTARTARFNGPQGVAVDDAGNVYVADTYNNTVRKVTPAGMVTTLAGLAGSSGSADGTGSAARFDHPQGVAVDGAGNLYVADTFNFKIREVTPAGVVTTLAGGTPGFPPEDGTGSAATFGEPAGLAVDGAGNLYVADEGDGAIRKVTPVGTNWVVTTLAGLARSYGANDGTGSAARFGSPFGVALDAAGNVYMTDTDNYTIREVTPAGVVTTLAGLAPFDGFADGTGSAARFFLPRGVAVDSAGNVYVADLVDDTIRKVTPVGTNWVVTTPAGLALEPGSADGAGTAARFNSPGGLAVDSADNLYVADTQNHTIRRVTPVGTNWVVTTLAGKAGTPGTADGTGNAARFNWPVGVAVDSAGNVYVADTVNCAIRKLTPAGTNWVVTTLAGLAGSSAAKDGTGSAARFFGPIGLAVDGAGNIYVADRNNSAIRKGIPTTAVPPPVLQPPNLRAGQVDFEIAGLPGLVTDLYSSGDLLEWQWVGRYILQGGTNQFVSPTPPQGVQFYRAHVR